jgi:hypothetical protein
LKITVLLPPTCSLLLTHDGCWFAAARIPRPDARAQPEWPTIPPTGRRPGSIRADETGYYAGAERPSPTRAQVIAVVAACGWFACNRLEQLCEKSIPQ